MSDGAITHKDFGLTKEQLAIIHHTKYRAAGGFYCGDSPEMQALVKQGLMESAGKKAFVPDEYFKLTDRGRQALRAIEQALS